MAYIFDLGLFQAFEKLLIWRYRAIFFIMTFTFTDLAYYSCQICGLKGCGSWSCFMLNLHAQALLSRQPFFPRELSSPVQVPNSVVLGCMAPALELVWGIFSLMEALFTNKPGNSYFSSFEDFLLIISS